MNKVRSISEYKKADFSNLKGLAGFSDKALDTHFSLYEGYVNNTNRILQDLKKLSEGGKMDTPEYAELKRRFGWEFNGMRLHELYFGALGSDGKIDQEGKFYRSLEENFGSFDAWKRDFISTGKMRGIGWAVLYQDLADGRLLNFWINEHDTGHGSGLNPLLVMDMFEHAFMIDYGKEKGSYIDAFMGVLNWKEIEKRIR